jgi:LPPG:FO 2-phospho-L-lactate transferase
VLAGGVGGARFLSGLAEVIPPNLITAVVNTGDDAEFYGLHVSPDLDTVMYTLAGLVNSESGWGLRDDTFTCLEELRGYGAETWFGLGDRDLATHLRRTDLLRAGQTLSQVTDTLRRAVGVGVRLLPMSDQRVRTMITTPAGELPFQEYFVKRAQQDDVLAVSFSGIEEARPAPGVLQAIADADLVVIAPSNPFVSVEPILSLPGVRTAITRARSRTVAISPIIGGAAVKGPAAQMLQTLGHEVSAAGVAAIYRDVVGTFIVDEVDAALAPRIADLGMNVVVTPTLMTGAAERRALAESALTARPSKQQDSPEQHRSQQAGR